MNVSLLQTGACSNKLHNGLFLLLRSAPTPASTSTDIDDTFTNKPETEIKSNNNKCLFRCSGFTFRSSKEREDKATNKAERRSQ